MGADWSNNYPEAEEELDSKFRTPLGKELTTTKFFNSDHAHNKVTKKPLWEFQGSSGY